MLFCNLSFLGSVLPSSTFATEQDLIKGIQKGLGGLFRVGDKGGGDGTKSILSWVGPCAAVGAAASKVFGEKKFREINVATCATCIAISAKMQYDYNQAIAEEKALIEIFNQGNMTSKRLDEENIKLEKKLKSAKREKSRLVSQIASGESSVIEKAALLQQRQDTLPDLIPIIDSGLQKAESELKGSTSSKYEKAELQRIYNNLQYRKQMIENSVKNA